MTTQVQGYRLSPQQAHLWPLLRHSPTAFLAQAVVALDGDLDAGLLRQALERIVARHQILRTTYHHTSGIPLPVQAIGESAEIDWREVDLRIQDETDLGRGCCEAAQRCFDLDRGPMLRGVLARLGERRYRLILTLPSMCADRGTLENLFEEIAGNYGRLRTEAPTDEGDEVVQYLQFSEWQHQVREEDDGKGAAYWQLQNLAEWRAPLPFARPVDPAVPFERRIHAVEIGEDALRQLEALAAAREASIAAVLLVAWQALLVRLTGRPRQITSVIVDGRKYDELRGGLGVFSCGVPVGPPLPSDLSFADAVGRMHEALVDAEEWQDFFVPEAFDLDHAVGFELARIPPSRKEGGVVFSLQDQQAPIERCTIALTCLPAESALRLEIAYDANRLDPIQAERIADRVRVLLADALARPEAPLGDLEAVGEEERRWLLHELNRTRADYPRDRCVHELFEAQAAATPDALAVDCEDLHLSYRELNARANQLARSLRALGVAPETRVVILLERSAATLVAIFGVLKAGGAYVPLDMAYPRERLAYMLDDARPRVVLTQKTLIDLLPPSEARVVYLERTGEEVDPQAHLDLPVLATDPENLVYIIYTSGSTGRPKGVMVSHRGLANYLSWAVRAYAVERGKATPVHSPLSFDLTVTALLTPLLAGRTVVLLPEREGIQALGTTLREPGDFSLVKITPAHLDLLQHDLAEAHGGAHTGALVLGGEALSGESLSFWRLRSAETRLINEYGPTETVVGCCVYEIPPDAELSGPVPIGRPIANSRLYLLDANGRPVPAGVAGEIYVGGDGVARGYHNRPDLTAERFVPDPFGGGRGERMYRTGDFARHLLDGNLEFLDRRDRQVKIRGIRIELGEVETALAQHPGVREVVVIDRRDEPGDGRRLVAYVVLKADGGAASPGFDALRRWLADRLPEYMIPSAFVTLERLPLTPNGKLDRSALPAPGTERPDLDREYVPPITEEERILAETWMDALVLERVGVHDNFFVLGGDSMRSVRVVNLARDKGLIFTVQDLFRHPTISGLVSALELRVDTGGGGDRELAVLLDELETLSEDEIQNRLSQMEMREAAE